MDFSDDEVERYARQLVLAEIGGPGQQKLKASSVLIVGCGGVGGPAALYLTAAGVGRIGLIDPDTVTLSNLQRQIQFATADIGRGKPDAMADRLNKLNPHVAVEAIEGRFDASTGRALAAHFDVVLDGTDDFETRLAVNDACLAAGRPLVSGALGRWTGQVAVFTGRPCYRCLVPEPPPDAETCARVGVIGALAGTVGAIAALEAIKMAAGAGDPLRGRLLIYDALSATTHTARIEPDPDCVACG